MNYSNWQKAKENLIKHTRFLRLSADERTQLFILYAESNELTKVKLLKTREEGGSTSSCEEQKQAAYSRQKLIMTMLSLTVKMVQCHLAA